MSHTESSRGVYGNDGRGKDETRARILLAARDCFARVGFDRTTVKMISAACGLTDAALYYYFPSKRHLLDALWDVRSRGSREPQQNHSPERDSDPLREINDAALDFLADNHQLIRIMFQEALGGDETALALRNESRAGWRRALYEHLAGILEPESVSEAVERIVALVTGMTMRAHIEAGDEFPHVARDPAFRQRIHRACLLAVTWPAERSA